MVAAPADAKPVVELAGLAKTFGHSGSKRAVRAVDRVDLTIQQGEVVALLGPNGAGKSTTVDLLLGLSRPDAGRALLFGGTPVSATRAGKVGVLLQNGGLLPDLSVKELLTLVGGLYPRALTPQEAMERAGITELHDRRVGRLSGGQTQRVRFALAVLPDPELLVLDEPTAAMDVEGRRAFWAGMRAEAAAGRTVVFCTHYLEEADAYADRIVLLRAGRVVADGPVSEIKALAGGRTIRATVESGPDRAMQLLRTSPPLRTVIDQVRAEVHGESLVLQCPGGPVSDSVLRCLLDLCPDARDIEVVGAGLQAAVLGLVGDSGAAPAPGADVPVPAAVARGGLL
jgi:ABC-2 type transport system ATP-binding protein